MGCLGALVLAVGLALALHQSGCGMPLTDAATRLAFQIEDEVTKMRELGETRRTFEHRPARWPEGIAGDYVIELRESTSGTRGALLVNESRAGAVHYHTTAHSNWVDVPATLVVTHAKGEAALVTIELRGAKPEITALE
jgi:hypothetical protein